VTDDTLRIIRRALRSGGLSQATKYLTLDQLVKDEFDTTQLLPARDAGDLIADATLLWKSQRALEMGGSASQDVQGLVHTKKRQIYYDRPRNLIPAE
jgi:hypothetical protein